MEDTLPSNSSWSHA
uniref:Uncharacterized protein n=1 Tax=Arundo donax TaxID=35708 RepID=A0A0A9H6Z6_ARUDO